MNHIVDGKQSPINAFKASIAPDLYSPRDIIDFSGANNVADSYEVEIAALSSLIFNNQFQEDSLTQTILKHPRLYTFICTLLSISASIELEDGRVLPAPTYPPKNEETAKNTANILFELGIDRLLTNPVNLKALFLVAQVGVDAPRRRLRVDSKIKSRVLRAIENAITAINKNGGKLSLVSTSSLPSSTRRIIEYVIAYEGIAKIAIAVTFQAYSGGRQTRDLTTIFPNVKNTLASSRISFLLIADGQGLRSTPDRVLGELFASIPNTMSLAQAEREGLLKAIERILSSPDEEPVNLDGLGKLVEESLMQSTGIKAEALPVNSAAARLTLANYASANNQLDLVLGPEGSSLSWRRVAAVRDFRRLALDFDGKTAIGNLTELLEGQLLSNDLSSVGFPANLVTLEKDPVFTSTFLIAAIEAKLTSETYRNIARQALLTAPSSRLAIVITAAPISPSELPDIRDIQTSLPVTIVSVDVSTCLSIAQNRENPRERLRALLLEQTDLTKLSPFVVRGVTPSRVFFGREAEEADLLSTLSTNSVALLGGRRIGKTSLMRHSTRRLESANLYPFFGDCQVVRTWADFGTMAVRNWQVAINEEFRPHHLFGIVQQLSKRSGRPIVILLDEIDQLLDWDRKHSEDEVPEAFFRACRSISQQGLAQFVFSGERTIANSLWDARSPHWNFCKPLMLRQLTRTAADSLLVEPLEDLGIRIEGRDDFLSTCWDSTDGHPELLQFIGDKLVGIVNQRSREDIYVSANDVDSLTCQFEYAEQYLETYWGQAEPLERIVSILLIQNISAIDKFIGELGKLGVSVDGKQLHEALRMLELYGIAEQALDGYTLRSKWFSTALSYYGGVDMAVKRYIGEINK